MTSETEAMEAVTRDCRGCHPDIAVCPACNGTGKITTPGGIISSKELIAMGQHPEALSAVNPHGRHGVAADTRPTPSVPAEGLVEAVAKALHESHNATYTMGGPVAWGNDPEHWRRYARAALSTLSTTPAEGLVEDFGGRIAVDGLVAIPEALYHQVLATLSAGTAEGLVPCVGCGENIGDREYVVDDNGETGCPACFTDDGAGECWSVTALVEAKSLALVDALGADGYEALKAALTTLSATPDHPFAGTTFETRAERAARLASDQADDVSGLAGELADIQRAFDDANTANDDKAWEAARTYLVAWFAIHGGSKAILAALRSTPAPEALRYPLDNLARAEANYRSAHDLFGGGDIRTGRAWDKMRRAGDVARTALSNDGGSDG